MAGRAKRKKSGLLMRKRKGITMVMMLIFVPIILIVAASYIDPIIRSYRAAVNDQKTLLASAVANSMFELALWESRGGGTGSVNEGCICQDGSCTIGARECEVGYDFGFGTATGEWKVYGAPETDAEHLIVEGSDQWYTVPSLGSGTAGGDYCSTANPVIDERMLEGKLSELGFNDPNNLPMDNPFDWPCHWNKIREGESVVIPLFTEDAGGVVRNPADLGMDRFELRFRAACNPEAVVGAGGTAGTICDDDFRYDVQGDDGQTDTVIVLWEIVGDEVDSGGVPTGEKIILGPVTIDVFNNSHIYNNKINNYKTSMYSLKEASNTEDNKSCSDDLINSHLLNTDICPTTQNINRPYLNLLVVHTLRDPNNQTIPYLEYQFKSTLDTPSEAPISNTSKVVRVDVMVDGGYSETLEKTIALPKPVSGFVISQ